MIAPDGKLTTEYPPSLMFEVVPAVKLKLFPAPDLSFHTLKLLTELNVMDAVDESAPSNHNAHPGIFSGDKVLPGKSFKSPHLAAR
jgi:hypothetical protein